MPEMISAYSIKLMNSVLLTAIFLGGYLLAKFFIARKIKIRKSRRRYLTRLKYLLSILFMICFIKIWVEGFVHILAFFGFLSAAITLTQKDNLMNLIGWLVINWRGLFSEEDYIRISNYGGYVKSIGFLYFTLLEASPEFPESKSGRIVKVPNGLVARNPVTNFSHDKLIECTLSFIFKAKGTFESIEGLFLNLKDEMVGYLQQHSPERMDPYEPKYIVKLRQEKPAGYEMVFLYYCRYVDKAQVQYKMSKMVVDYSHGNERLELAFD